MQRNRKQYVDKKKRIYVGKGNVEMVGRRYHTALWRDCSTFRRHILLLIILLLYGRTIFGFIITTDLDSTMILASPKKPAIDSRTNVSLLLDTRKDVLLTVVQNKYPTRIFLCAQVYNDRRRRGVEEHRVSSGDATGTWF